MEEMNNTATNVFIYELEYISRIYNAKKKLEKHVTL